MTEITASHGDDRVRSARRALGEAVIFALGLLAFEAWWFGQDVVGFIAFYVERAAMLDRIRGLALVVATLAAAQVQLTALVWASLLAPLPRRLVYAGAFAAASLLGHGYQNALGRFPALDDFRIARSVDPSTLLDAVVGYAAWSAALPVAAFVLFVAARTRQPDAPAERGAAPRLEIGALLVVAAITLLYPLTIRFFPTTSPNAVARVLAVGVWHEISRYDGPRDTVPSLAAATPSYNVVLIVDESVRADHLSVNGYSRPTTPAMEALAERGLLRSWDIGVAGATNSIDANAALLTGMFGLPGSDRRLRQAPTLFQYARAAGFRTHYLDAASRAFWLGGQLDLESIDEYVHLGDLGEIPLREADFQLAEMLADILSSGVGNFVWVNKRGAHWPYWQQYSEGDEIWRPAARTRDLGPGGRDDLVNSYDNALRYNVDGFFRILGTADDGFRRSFVLYTADHGQTLGEVDGERRTHGGGSRLEATVPIILLTGSEVDVDTAFRASHADVFATLVDLLGIEVAEQSGSETERLGGGISLLRARASDSRPRHYLWQWGLRGGVGGYRLEPFDADGAGSPW